MYLLRRWWDRYGQQIVLWSLILSIAWLFRETQGFLILEAYRVITQPQQVDVDQPDYLTNAKILELQARLVELESQNRNLRQLLDYVSERPKQGVVAAIIGRSADNWWQQIILSRGSRDGLQTGDVVTGIGGLVGRVISVTPHTSRVLLVSDPQSRVGVMISRSRAMGIIRGQADNRAVMQFFDKVPDVRRGDVVTTSTLSLLFPPGLPVGRVESVDLRKSPVPEAIIELSAPISHLEWAMIYPKPQLAKPVSALKP